MAPLASQAAASPTALSALQLGLGLSGAKRAATESPRAGSLTPRRKRASLTALSREPARAAPASPGPADACADRLRPAASPQAMPPLPVTRLFRAAGGELSLRRLLRAGWTDIARGAEEHDDDANRRRRALMLDRLGLVAPRLAVGAADPDRAAQGAFAELRIGLNVLDLCRLGPRLPAAGAGAVAALLASVAAYFRTRICGGRADPPAALLDRIDAALRAVTATPPASRLRLRWTLLALAGLRRGMFPAAADYAPA